MVNVLELALERDGEAANGDESALRNELWSVIVLEHSAADTYDSVVLAADGLSTAGRA